MPINQSYTHGLILMLCLSATSSVYGNPDPIGVTAGEATITQTSTTTHVEQHSKQAVIEWNSFNIGTQEHTHFQQPTGGVALNRISTNSEHANPTQILGRLSATGRIILINPAGFYFGSGAHVDVGGLIVSTANLTNQRFLAEDYRFEQSTNFPGAIINEGRIIAANYGLVALLGANITNRGVIQANLGHVILSSGNTFTLDFYGDQLINFSVPVATTQHAKIENTGTLLADGGKILVSANTASHILDNVIDMHGITQANSVHAQQGGIILTANQGTISIAGKIKAKGHIGGSVKVLAKNIQIKSSSVINANGKTKAGTVILIAEQNMDFFGKILAKSKTQGGQGGFVEISGKEHLNFHGKVDLSAPQGVTGTLLLDPYNVTIQTAGTSTTTPSGTPTNTETSNTYNSILTVADLQNALASANVLIVTGSGGNQVGNITIANNIFWNNSNTLSLSAFKDINVNATISNYAGGSLNLRADNTHTGIGTIQFNAGGNVTMSGGGVVNFTFNSGGVVTPNNYTPYVHVSNGTTYLANSLNTLNPTQNAAITNSITQVNTQAVYAEQKNAALKPQGPVNTDNVVPPQVHTVTTMNTELATIRENETSVVVQLADSTNHDTCNTAKNCETDSFIIK